MSGPHRRGLGDDVVAGDAGDPGVRAQQRREDVDDRGLSGAVRAEQREDAAGRDVEVDAVEHDLVAEGLHEPFGLDGGVIMTPSWVRPVRGGSG